MVRIQVKYRGDGCAELKFLYDCETTSTVQEITKDITEIANLHLQIQRLGLRLLPPLSALLHTHSQAIALHRALSEATSYASKEQVLHGRLLSSLVLRDHIRSIEKEFAANFHVLDFPESNLKQFLSDLELLQEDSVQLWWAGKEFTKGKTLRDYIGKNEKTKVHRSALALLLQFRKKHSERIVIRCQIMLGLQSHISNPYPACNSTSGNYLAGDASSK